MHPDCIGESGLHQYTDWHVNAGSIIVPAADDTTDSSVLQNELKGRSTKIVLAAFDLLTSTATICVSCP